MINIIFYTVRSKGIRELGEEHWGAIFEFKDTITGEIYYRTNSDFHSKLDALAWIKEQEEWIDRENDVLYKKQRLILETEKVEALKEINRNLMVFAEAQNKK